MPTKNLGVVFEQTRNEQTFKLEMTNIIWKIPHVTPSDFAKTKCSWTLMHYGQYKQVAFTTPSNDCYARSPKPIWASKRNRGHGKRRHNNSQFKIHAHIEWLVT